MHGIPNTKFLKALEEQAEKIRRDHAARSFAVTTSTKSETPDMGHLGLGDDGSVYRRIGSAVFSLMGTLPCNIFRRIGPNQFEQAFSQDKGLTSEGVQSISEQQTDWFIHEDDVPKFTIHAQNVLANAFRNDQIATRTKIDVLHDILAMTLKQTFSRTGITSFNLQQAVTLTDHIVKYVSKNVVALSMLMSAFKKDEAVLRHSVTVSCLAMLLARQTSYNKRQDLLTIGIAGLFHDMGLMRLPQNLRDKEMEEMTPEEWVLYSQHPQISADLLRDSQTLPSLVTKVIVQHHELPNGRGFPHSLAMKDIHPYARILSVADRFNDLVVARGSKPAIHPMKALDLMNGLKGEFDPEFIYKFTFLFFPKDE